jgi:hypothetical protein
MLKLLVILSAIFAISAIELSVQHAEIRRTIIDNYLEGSPKELFKVFHYIFQKPYDINTEIALAKYKVFKKNLQYIKEHNAKKLSWTLEVNFFADMTLEEIKAYLGASQVEGDNSLTDLLKGYNFEKFDRLVDENENSGNKRNLQALSFFDALADNEDVFANEKVEEIEKEENLNAHRNIDHSADLNPPRDQGFCSANWVFSALTAIEGNYNYKRRANNSDKRVGALSVQQIIDCNMNRWGCMGAGKYGVFEAIKQVAFSGVASDDDYPYIANQNMSCNLNPAKVDDLIFVESKPYRGCHWECQNQLKECSKKNWYGYLEDGPVVTFIELDMDFSFYKEGVVDLSKRNCTSPHFNLVAFAWTNELDGEKPTGREIITLRNFAGAGWGENGNIRYYYNKNGTCFITKAAILPNLK